MTKEQEEAINVCERIIKNRKFNLCSKIDDDDMEAIKTVLNLIQQLQEESKQKDKQIDLMAEHIVSSAIVDDTVCAIKFCEIEEDCTHEKMLNCTKQYFKKKASEE